MKFLKKSLVAILVLIIISMVGGYFYFDKKFTPKPNYLTVYGKSGQIPIYWETSSSSKISALLLPVQINGIDEKFYVQFDTGSPYTLFYKSSLDKIQNFFDSNFKTDSTTVQLNFHLGKMEIKSDKFMVYNVKTNWTKTDSIKIIGTIGTDLMEKRTTTLNFKESFVVFDTTKLQKLNSDFEFKKRRILIPVKINNIKTDLIFDSGTSAFELITNKDNWVKLKIPNQEINSSKGNSWGNTLTIYTSASNKQIKFQNKSLRLDEVTYIDGYSTIQYLMMKFSGMGGMLGNKIFMDKTITFDCKNEEYLIE